MAKRDGLHKRPKKSLERLTKHWDENSWHEKPYTHSAIEGNDLLGSSLDRGTRSHIATLKAWRFKDE